MRPSNLGKAASIRPGLGTGAGSRGVGDFRSGGAALDSIANILDATTAKPTVQAPEPVVAEILSALEKIGGTASVRELAQQTPLSNQELATSLAKAGQDGHLAFSQAEDGTTFVQIAKPY